MVKALSFVAICTLVVAVTLCFVIPATHVLETLARLIGGN